jgi:predicted GNAT superfamily acetyltransferase
MAEETQMRDGVASDWLFIDSLRKKEGSALGFIPKDAYLSILEHAPRANRARYKYQRVLVTLDNDDLTGFAYTSYASEWASIIQIVVRSDARRWHRAMLMADEVERDAVRYGKKGVTCRVAYDLESNFFWRAIGYLPIKQVVSTWLNQRESKSKRPLWVYRKEIGGLFASESEPRIPIGADAVECPMVSHKGSEFGSLRAKGATGGA